MNLKCNITLILLIALNLNLYSIQNNIENNLNKEKLDFSNKDKWPKVNMLLKIFPGKIKN